MKKAAVRAVVLWHNKARALDAALRSDEAAVKLNR